jgi:hypothetical protein
LFCRHALQRYVQPDEFLVSGEALIRNLLLAASLVNQMNGKIQPVAYLPGLFFSLLMFQFRRADPKVQTFHYIEIYFAK